MKLPSIKFKLPKVKIYGIDVIKNAFFFTFYLFLTIFIIAFVLTPSIKIFKKEKRNYYIVKNRFDKLNTQYETILKEINNLKKRDRNILLKLNRDFNIESFKYFAKNYMEILDLKKLETKTYKNRFVIMPFLVTAKIPSPQNFYKFIDDCKKYKNIIKVYFPINFEKSKEEINLTFKIEVFKLKEKNIIKRIVDEN